jgi:type 1 fimbria pilin
VTIANPTQLYSTNKDLRAVIYGKDTGIAILDAWGNGATIDNRHLSMTTITIYNEGANSLDYKVWGHLDDNNGSAPAFDGTWTELPKVDCTTAVAGGVSKAATLTENWAWILIRFKRTASGQATTATVTMRSRQSRY